MNYIFKKAYLRWKAGEQCTLPRFCINVLVKRGIVKAEESGNIEVKTKKIRKSRGSIG